MKYYHLKNKYTQLLVYNNYIRLGNLEKDLRDDLVREKIIDAESEFTLSELCDIQGLTLITSKTEIE